MESIILLGKKMFKVIETFSGIGAQAKALERIGIEHEIIHTCDWDIGAIIAYCQIHKGGIHIEKYSNISDETIDNYLKNTTLSMDGKKTINEKTYERIPAGIKRMIYVAIQETNNFVSITDVHGDDIEENIDLLTYSFPCQDLSMCGYWHGNKSGISRTAHNRSGMLWEVERILKEMDSKGKSLPKFLVMENVTNILSATHKEDFDDWKNTLEELGYINKIYRLNAKNFGVPQKRERAYMISILCKNDIALIMQIKRYFEEHDLEQTEVAAYYKERDYSISDILKLNYDIDAYRKEADESQPNDTPSRKKIFNENDMLFDGKEINNIIVNTVTTKQDRNPNSGLITYENGKEGKTKWRYLTPRECFLLMGFNEKDYERTISCNPEYSKGRVLLTNEKLIRMAGNSICVDVLEAIFRQILELRRLLFDKSL